MKYAKRIFSLLVVLVLCSSLLVPALAAPLPEAEAKASALKQLHLFKGVSDTDFDLGRAPTRTEALVMLIRVLGKESEALNGNYSHPFKDTEPWADKYIGYAYSNGLSKGISATEFGSGNADSDMYLTFVLRALGYDDSKGDFVWDEPDSLARSVGILPAGTDTSNFLRADVAIVSWVALDARMKDGSRSLAEKLISDGIFKAEDYTAAKKKVQEAYSVTPSNAYELKDGKALVKSFAELKGALSADNVKQIEFAESFNIDEDITITKPVLVVELGVRNSSVLTVKSELTLGGVNFENTGSISVASGGVVGDYMSNINNWGTFTVESGGKLDIDRGGEFKNHGKLINLGTIVITSDGGNMLNEKSGKIENNGKIDCTGFYKNEGSYSGTAAEPKKS